MHLRDRPVVISAVGLAVTAFAVAVLIGSAAITAVTDAPGRALGVASVVVPAPSEPVQDQLGHIEPGPSARAQTVSAPQADTVLPPEPGTLTPAATHPSSAGTSGGERESAPREPTASASPSEGQIASRDARDSSPVNEMRSIGSNAGHVADTARDHAASARGTAALHDGENADGGWGRAGDARSRSEDPDAPSSRRSGIGELVGRARAGSADRPEIERPHRGTARDQLSSGEDGG